MRHDMKDGFADLRAVLDSRFESRDRQLEDHEKRTDCWKAARTGSRW